MDKVQKYNSFKVRTYSIAVCLSLPSHSWFPSYRASLVFFVSDPVCHVNRQTPICISLEFNIYLVFPECSNPKDNTSLMVEVGHCKPKIKRLIILPLLTIEELQTFGIVDGTN
jgi:hypothetical protein